MRLWVTHVTEHRDHMLVLQRERQVIERGPRWRAIRSSRKHFERLLEDVIHPLHGTGELVLAGERLSAAALFGMVNHTAQWYRPRGRLTPIEIADGYVDLLIRAGDAPREFSMTVAHRQTEQLR
ncbi:MAG: hypothetical protein JO325_11400 [Solirubrobacterales bacterium]|nr:hypothetical protein [Solirubrobacterales bacterium]